MRRRVTHTLPPFHFVPPPSFGRGFLIHSPPVIGGIVDEGGGVSPTHCLLLTSFTPLIGGVVLIYLKILNVLKIN